MASPILPQPRGDGKRHLAIRTPSFPWSVHILQRKLRQIENLAALDVQGQLQRAQRGELRRGGGAEKGSKQQLRCSCFARRGSVFR